MVAIILLVATILASCKEDLPQTDAFDSSKTPTQVVYDIYASQSNTGVLSYKMIAPKMERYENAETPYEIFPDGFQILGYTSEGLLETRILADQAMHITEKSGEKWEAYGNVEITNYLEGQVVKTDTLYWDRKKAKIFTDCFVTLSSPQGFMQGYGMESDEMARNAEILRPFDNFFYVQNDSVARQYVDTANFVGPILKKR